jgi:hypothetical protein
MPDISALAAALSSLNAAKDIAQAMIGLRDAAAFQTKLIEFQSKLIEANGAALTAQDERASLLQEIRALKEKVARLETWETEKKKYELRELFPGAMAYVLKEEAKGTEPTHWLCAACYHGGQKSVLQKDIGKQDPTGRTPAWSCPACDAIIFVRYDIWPGHGPTF